MTESLSIENLRSISSHIGLRLLEDELQRLLPGVNRARIQAAELRDLVAAGDEPAPAFDASGKSTK